MADSPLNLCRIARGWLSSPGSLQEKEAVANLDEAIVQLTLEGGRAVIPEQRIDDAIELAVKYGGINGSHHKNWVIDQMVRILAGDDYKKIVAAAKAGEDGPETYDWDEGIAP